MEREQKRSRWMRRALVPVAAAGVLALADSLLRGRRDVLRFSYVGECLSDEAFRQLGARGGVPL